MNAHLPYTATARNGLDSLLDRWESKFWLYMRDTGLSPEGERCVTSPEKRQKIMQMAEAGTPLKVIAQETQMHYVTVTRLTRHLRSRGRGRPAKEA